MNSCSLPPRIVFLLPLMAGLWTASAQVRLNEFMASNSSTAVPNAVAGNFHDWIELFNAGGTPVDLSGWHLTDNFADPFKWTFPAGTVIPAGGYRVVFASGNNAPDANGNLHTNFSLNAGGEYLGLSQPDGTEVSAFEPGGLVYPPQESNVSFGRKPGDLSPVYFATATPGAPNAADGYLRVAPITASVKRGFYASPFSVTLGTTTPGASVYYTLDSSPPLQANGTPAAGAAQYTVPINITTTTVLRSAAVRTGYDPTAIDSQTYIFPATVATQTKPASYPIYWGGTNLGDYAVDPAVSQSAADQTRFQAGLRSLPTLSVSATMESLFGASGIYTLSTNDLLEAAVSAEYFKPAASGDGVNVEAGFQINCGFKVQGGSSRNFSSSAKHSFSLRFRTEYGAGKLDYDLFGSPSVDSFDSVQLRAMYNNSWTHSAADQRARADMIRDQWMRDSLIAMGQPDGGHGKYVNLYLNGLFWGVYNLHERLDNDHYAAYQDGVEDETVYSYNPGQFTAAEQTSLNLMKTAVTSGNWANIEARLDVDSYIDYYIMQHFGHNDDLKTDGNWRAAGGGTGNHRWRFYLWDSERTLEGPANTGVLASSQDGAGIIDGLDHLPEFQVRFADRAWKHLTNGGALVNDRNRARFSSRVTELDDAITGESARWGDNRSGGSGPTGDYTRANNWLPAINGPLSTNPTGGILGPSNSWFPASGNTHRTNTILTAWKTQTWTGTTVTKLPNVDPPAFTVNNLAQHGGVIPSGGVLRLTGGTGTLYVTTDGSDPRQSGGAVQPGLTAYTAGNAVPLTASSTVRTRWFNGTRWSALNEAVFFMEPLATATSSLRITEINYRPALPSPLEQATGAALIPPVHFSEDDFQFIEIENTGNTPVNLSGCRLSGGVACLFGNVPLTPGGRAVAVESAKAYAVRYPLAPLPSGIWTGNLAHGGETIELLAGTGEVITRVTYADGGAWPSRPDGDGSTLEATGPSGDPDNPLNWRASIRFHGTPGTAGPAADGRILVNEILAHSTPPAVDYIELVNSTTAPVDLSGWFLSDGKSNYRKFRIPDGTVIPSGGYVVFDESHFNQPSPKSITGFSGTGAAAPVAVTSPAHGLATGDTLTISGYGGFGQYNDSFQVSVTGPDTFTIPAVFLDNDAVKGTWTRGQPFALNASGGEDIWLLEGKAGGELVSFVDHVAFPATLDGISTGRWPDAHPDSFLLPMLTRTPGAPNSGVRAGPLIISEIMGRPTASPEADLEFVEILNTGTAAQNLAHWTLRGDVDYDFPDQNLTSGSRLVVVGFSPADTPRVNAFRSHYNITPQVALAGPWATGQLLGNARGMVRLRRADAPPPETPNLHPQVIEDEAAYSTGDLWPVPADGPWVQSLNRTGPDTFGGTAASWTAANPTPGYPLPAVATGFAAWLQEHLLTDGAGGDADADGIINLVEYALHLNPALSDTASLPQAVLAGNELRLVYLLRNGPGDPIVIPQASSNLKDWVTVPDTSTTVLGGMATRTARVPIPPDTTRLYLRLYIAP